MWHRVEPIEEKLHQKLVKNDKEDLIEDYGKRGRLNSTLLKQKANRSSKTGVRSWAGP